MVILHFKMSELGTVSLDIETPETLAAIITRTAAGSEIDPGGCIAIRAGKVIGADTLIADGDEVTILPAISGG